MLGGFSWLRSRREARVRGPRLSPAAIVTLVMATLSCAGDGPTGTGSDDPPPATERLPVHVHVLSSRLAPLDASLTAADVDALFRRVNEVWAQADVVWEARSVVFESAADEDRFERALEGLTPLTTDVLIAVVPSQGLPTGAWDVFLVGDLTSAIGAPGIFVPSVPLILSSELDPAGLNDPGRILAHELGHSLTLPHVPCTPAGNLMSPGCASTDRTRLTALQIAQARVQALAGKPTGISTGS